MYEIIKPLHLVLSCPSSFVLLCNREILPSILVCDTHQCILTRCLLGEEINAKFKIHAMHPIQTSIL
jgi:hypothetical protein